MDSGLHRERAELKLTFINHNLPLGTATSAAPAPAITKPLHTLEKSTTISPLTHDAGLDPKSIYLSAEI